MQLSPGMAYWLIQVVVECDEITTLVPKTTARALLRRGLIRPYPQPPFAAGPGLADRQEYTHTRKGWDYTVLLWHHLQAKRRAFLSRRRAKRLAEIPPKVQAPLLRPSATIIILDERRRA